MLAFQQTLKYTLSLLEFFKIFNSEFDSTTKYSVEVEPDKKRFIGK